MSFHRHARSQQYEAEVMTERHKKQGIILDAYLEVVNRTVGRFGESDTLDALDVRTANTNSLVGELAPSSLSSEKAAAWPSMGWLTPASFE